MAQLNAAGGATSVPPGTSYVLGHEFTAEIVDYGPETEGTLRVGSTVCALPYAMGPTGMEVIGFSPTLPGGYGELMVLQEAMLVPVPEGLDARTAALTEPLAVGEHSVGLADVQPGWPCHVVGCGPIGLAIIVALKARGAGPISASDLSPSRRALAARLGADVVLDPAEGTGFPDFAELGVPTNPLQRAASIGMGSAPPRAAIFEAVGKPGMIRQIIDAAPPGSRIVVAGVDTQGDRFGPALAVVKELELRFGFGYAPKEFAATLARVARSPEAVAPLITSTVGVDGVTGAIDALRVGEQIKVLIEH
jgi:threonine dehydrogenase-like Zn-dependent dehydrogenase